MYFVVFSVCTFLRYEFFAFLISDFGGLFKEACLFTLVATFVLRQFGVPSVPSLGAAEGTGEAGADSASLRP